MAPKKQQQQKQQEAAAAATTATTESATQKQELVAEQQQQQEEETLAMPSPLLDKQTLVVLDDGRQVVGHLIAFDSTGSALLQNVVERKQVKEGLVVQRTTMSLSIPANRMKEFYQRDDTAPEIKEIEERHQAFLTAKQEKEQQERKKLTEQQS